MGREEQLADSILAGPRKDHADITGSTPQEFVRNLKQDSCSVASTRITALRTTMGQVFENLQSLADDVVRFLAFNVDHEANAAGIVFICRIIETLRWRQAIGWV